MAISSARDKKVDTLLLEEGYYHISKPILPFNGLCIRGISKSKVIIEQETWGHPAFDVFNADGVTIKDLTIISNQKRTYPNGFVERGTDWFVNNAGIYSNGENGRFENLTIAGYTCGIFLSSWDGRGLYDQKSDNQISNLKVDKVDFGILATGQRDLIIENVSGRYKQQQGSTAAPHFIYISDALDPKYAWTENLTIRNCYAMDGPEGFAYQIGSVKKGHLTNLNSIRCEGILAIKNFVNIVVDTMIALEDSTHEVGSIFIQPVNVTDNVFENIRIESLNPEARLLRLDGVNNVYKNIVLKTAIDRIDDKALATFQGENSKIFNLEINSLNPKVGAIGLRLQGKNLYAENISCDACRAGFTITEDCENCTVNYESKKITSPSNYKGFSFYYNYSKTSKIVDRSK